MNAGWRRPEKQFNQGYNQNQRQHPGFQWSNPQGGQYAPTAPYQPPHQRRRQFQPPAQAANTPTKTIEEMFAAIMAKTTIYDKKFNNVEASIKKLEIQMGQLASTVNQREPGRFPSQPEVNPREHEHAKAITTLRSGRLIDNKVDHPLAPEIEEEEHEHVTLHPAHSGPTQLDLSRPSELQHASDKRSFRFGICLAIKLELASELLFERSILCGEFRNAPERIAK